MSSSSTSKWSSSVSLTKFFSRVTRTLSFSSKKNKKSIQHPQPSLKNTLSSVPKSVPVIRRLPSPPAPKIFYDDYSDEEFSRYSLRPNLSLLNVSMDNLPHQTEDLWRKVPLHGKDWIDDIFHSTKTEHY